MNLRKGLMVTGAIMIVVGLIVAVVLGLINGFNINPSPTNPHPNLDLAWGIGIAVCGFILVASVYFAPIWQIVTNE